MEGKEEWNKKRILIAIVIAAILLGVGAYWLKNGLLGQVQELAKKAVQGASSGKENTSKELDKGVSKDNSLPLQTAIQEKLGDLKKEVDKLNVVEVATASPQIQKIINDLNSLKDYPVNEAKEICRQICGL